MKRLAQASHKADFLVVRENKPPICTPRFKLIGISAPKKPPTISDGVIHVFEVNIQECSLQNKLMLDCE